MIQMANKLGPLSPYNQLRLKFVKTAGFDVRCWFPGELHSAFRQGLVPMKLKWTVSSRSIPRSAIFCFYSGSIGRLRTLRKPCKRTRQRFSCGDRLVAVRNPCLIDARRLGAAETRTARRATTAE